MVIPTYPGWPGADEVDSAEESVSEQPKELSNAQKEKIRRESFEYVNKALEEAYNLYTDKAIEQLAKQVLGDDFWEGLRLAARLRHGKVDGLPALTECLSKLVGSYTPANIAASMLHAKREEEHARAFLEAKEKGFTDGTSDQFARLRVGKLRLQEKAFEGLTESLNEMIQVCKRLQDAELSEMQHLGKQPF